MFFFILSFELGLLFVVLGGYISLELLILKKPLLVLIAHFQNPYQILFQNIHLISKRAVFYPDLDLIEIVLNA